MFCSKCGKPIDDSSAFCNYCGAKIDEKKTEQEKAGDAIQPIASNTEDPSGLDSSTQSTIAVTQKQKNWVMKVGKILAIIGIAGFLTIAFVGLIIWGKVYLYNGFDLTKVLCTLCLILMILGLCGIVVGLILAKKKAPVKKKSLVFPIILIVLASIFSITLIVSGIQSGTGKKQTSSSSYSSASSTYEMDHATYCYLYIKVSNVKVTHSGNYAYISGTVTNTGTYQVKYVKVRAACKDYRGNIIDTDWTYAVDSSWLNPGESKKFEMMVKDTGNDISTASVTVVYE